MDNPQWPIKWPSNSNIRAKLQVVNLFWDWIRKYEFMNNSYFCLRHVTGSNLYLHCTGTAAQLVENWWNNCQTFLIFLIVLYSWKFSNKRAWNGRNPIICFCILFWSLEIFQKKKRTTHKYLMNIYLHNYDQ